ncbi:31769_t:CDS:2 [Gigaspora margarita]|uniref:31769_t:CDS:1 n=1 Tax=Gigaspora margarita TaxID=4874 RepID=A0ABM8W554_GIGMA|nr:31769_t:CDS:2 [Gigaspora margarita]
MMIKKQINDKESVKATNYNSIKETTASEKKKNMNKESYKIERIRKESLLLKQENNRIRSKYLHLKKENKRNFTNSEHSSDIVEKKEFCQIWK